MSAFDKVIGYESIKTELLQIIDMINHREVYEKLGARLPHGAILYGEPGIGKTLLATSFIEESGLPSFTVRKNKGDDFVASVTDTFEEAKKSAPSIVFLDDLDKFANEDRSHRDAEEYVAVQAGIDDVSDAEVFVIATANDVEKLPSSLVRSGRFDREIEVECPSESDAEKIIAYYLSGKKVAATVNMEDLSKMICYSSCAKLETILNEAAVSAAYKRKEEVEMSDLVNAVLRMQYNSPEENYSADNEDEARRLALHEAGHLVCCEVLCPGSVGFASIRPNKHRGRGGFIHRCKELTRRPHYVIATLAAKAAVELYYADHVASGCGDDIRRAYDLIRDGMAESATVGFGMVDVATERFPYTSESMNARHEAVTQALLEQYMLQAKDILIQNREFLELAAAELQKNGILLYSDIQRIKGGLSALPISA